MKGKLGQIYQDLGLLNEPQENSLLKNLTKPPPHEPNSVMPHTSAPVQNATHQADLLYLPDDDGYKYLLVVVDIATRRTDAEPLTSRDSKAVKKALQTIYKRPILKRPLRIEIDSGSEFKGEFKTFFEKYATLLTKITGRHRQQSVVETKNHLIGKILNERMLAEEINNDEESHSWVDIVPKVVKLINQHYSHPAIPDDPFAEEKVNATNENLIPLGTKVRIQLDNPSSYQGDKLHGKFRAGDIRWTKEPHTITDYYLRPNFPPMYQVDNNNKVAYTVYQLQLVKQNEVKPPTVGQKRLKIVKLVKRYKQSGKIMFKVKWIDGTTTEEPRTHLMKDVPQLVKEFESN